MSDSTRQKREMELGEWRLHLRQGPRGLEHVWYLTVFKGGTILLATNESEGRRHRLHDLFDVIADGLRSRAGIGSDSRREIARGGMGVLAALLFFGCSTPAETPENGPDTKRIVDEHGNPNFGPR